MAQEQVNDATGYVLDGLIGYIDEAGKPPEFYTAGCKNRINQQILSSQVDR